jgi:flagellar hook-basal body complex protein FliE
MTFPIAGIGSSFPVFDPSSVGATTGAAGAAGVSGTTGTAGTQSSSGADFASVLASSIDGLQATQSTADKLATQAATGDLKDVHDYMIASNEASLATEMVVTIKNKAVEAFNEIMRMPV